MTLNTKEERQKMSEGIIEIMGELNPHLRDVVDWPQSQPPGGYDNLANYIGSEKEYPGENDGYVYQKYNAVVNALFFGCLKVMEKIAIDLDEVEDALLFK